jgi:acetylornithine deacetylase
MDTALNVVQLAQDMVAIESESRISNEAICDFLEKVLDQAGFDVERLVYTDAAGVSKHNLVARKGAGSGGLGFFSHTDTVPGAPGEPQAWKPFKPAVAGGRLVGRGSCDMKGPLAATLVAAARVDPAHLKRPLWLALTADEEVGYGGAYHVSTHSRLFNESWPHFGVVAEPTNLLPVYAHKGRVKFTVTAHGVSAHASTDRGVSSNFLVAPFLAEMAELHQRLRTDVHFWNREFDPPTNSLNMVLDDGGCATNVTAAKTVCTLDLRTMPNDRHGEVVAIVTEAAEKHNLELIADTFDPFYISPDSEIVQAALTATGAAKATTVPYGTEAAVYKDFFGAVILGPGDIAQAHTVGEWIEVAQLETAVDVYGRLIELLCMQ